MGYKPGFGLILAANYLKKGPYPSDSTKFRPYSLDKEIEMRYNAEVSQKPSLQCMQLQKEFRNWESGIFNDGYPG